MLTQKTIYSMSYHEVENLVYKHYGWKKFEFPEAEECSNDSSKTYTIDGDLDECDIERLEEIKNGCDNWEVFQFTGSLMLNKLCADGHIPAGNYVIDVSW